MQQINRPSLAALPQFLVQAELRPIWPAEEVRSGANWPSSESQFVAG